MSTDSHIQHDHRIDYLIDAAERLTHADFNLNLPPATDDEIGRLSRAFYELAHHMELRARERQRLDRITTNINAGLLLDDILDNVYRDFQQIIPYNRIGFSLIENGGCTVRARWAKTDQPNVQLNVGFSANLEGSSLADILRTKQPRIINDLVTYLEQKPDSESTRLIVEEGIRSSLTCPLIANDVPVGFMFFSSVKPHAYSPNHVEVFRRIADQLSTSVEHGRLVSELAAQKEAIEAQNDELRRIDEIKNTFLGIAAHDLRSPIANIQMMAYLLVEPTPWMSQEQRQDVLLDVYNQTQHMLVLLDDLLDVTQIEAGKLDLEPKVIDVSDFLERTVKRQAHLASRKNTLVELVPVQTGHAWADPVRLRQVVDNLISNAVKYGPPGGVVRVWAERRGENWRVNVQDNGPGILPEDRGRLFQDFGRLSAQPTGGEKSIGLGLAIARRIIEAHGGVINVDSEPDEGACFWFTIPTVTE